MRKKSLRELREKRGLSVSEFAQKLDIIYPTYVKKENFERKLNAYELRTIVNVLNEDINAIAIDKEEYEANKDK